MESMTPTHWKAIAFFLGLLLLFVATYGLAALLGDNSPLLTPAIVALYLIAGAALGYLAPNVGWQLGLWLSACWLALIPLAFLIGDRPAPGVLITKREAGDLLAHTIPAIAACVGAAAGSLLARRKATND